MKFPGIYYAYSAILALFGQTVTGVHMGLLVVNLLSTVILYLLARPLLGSAGAALAGAAFIIMSADTSVLGLFAHATHFVVMFALAGIWLLQESSKSKRKIPLLWGSGLCLGLALLMKQSGAFFAMFGFLWVLYEAFRRRPISWKLLLLEAGSLAGGVVLPYAAVVALLAHQGVLDRFWFWTFDYARAYATEIDLKMGLQLFQSAIIPIIRNNPADMVDDVCGHDRYLVHRVRTKGRTVSPAVFPFFIPGSVSRFFLSPALFRAVPAGSSAQRRRCGVGDEKAAAKYTAKSKAIQFAVLVASRGVFAQRRFFNGARACGFDPGPVQPLGLRRQSISRIRKGRRVYKEQHQARRSYCCPGI